MFNRDRSVKYQIVDVFSTTPFCGNAAGVVVDASTLEDSEMQKIAREVNISNTSFLSDPEKGGDVKIRYFCPESEINMCGHATIGSIYAWGEKNIRKVLKGGKGSLKVETRIGTLSVKLKCCNERLEEVFVALPSPEFCDVEIDRQRLFEALRIEESATVKEYPIEIVNSGLLFIEVGIKDRDKLMDIKPRFDDIRKITEELDVDAVQVFTLDTFEKKSTVLSRTFFPRYGVNEDPVCGTGNAAVSSYLIHNKIIGNNEEKIIGEQGYSVARPGKVFVKVKRNKNKIENMMISGSAALAFEGSVYLN